MSFRMSFAPRFPTPVERIGKIVDGEVVRRAERDSDGCFLRVAVDTKEGPIRSRSLGDVAEFLRKNPRSGARMHPGWPKLSRSVLMDGKPR